MFRIFTSAKALADTYLKESKRTNMRNQSKWFHILMRQPEIYTNGYTDTIPDNVSDIDIFSDTYILYLLQLDHPDIRIVPQDEYLQDIYIHPERILDYPNSVFYIDMPYKQAHTIQTEYGVIVQSTERKIDTKPLATDLAIYDFKRKEQVEKMWNDIFNIPHHAPANAICIVDRYLFAGNAENGLCNVLYILRSALPQSLKTEFHVTIIFEYESETKSKELANQIFALEDTLHRPYPIIMEMIAFHKPDKEKNIVVPYHNEITHNRQILSNYYHIGAENGIGFINYMKRPRSSNYAQRLLSTLLYSTGLASNTANCPIDTNKRFIDDYRNFMDNWRKDQQKDEHYWYACNNGEKDYFMKFTNRLFCNP